MIGKLDLYRIFNVVSRNKSFSKAAKELYMKYLPKNMILQRLKLTPSILMTRTTLKRFIMIHRQTG